MVKKKPKQGTGRRKLALIISLFTKTPNIVAMV
jgi:hypothetical protein